MYPGSTKKDKYIDKTKKEEKDSENKEKKLQIKYSLDLDKIEASEVFVLRNLKEEKDAKEVLIKLQKVQKALSVDFRNFKKGETYLLLAKQISAELDKTINKKIDFDKSEYNFEFSSSSLEESKSQEQIKKLENLKIEDKPSLNTANPNEDNTSLNTAKKSEDEPSLNTPNEDETSLNTAKVDPHSDAEVIVITSSPDDSFNTPKGPSANTSTDTIMAGNPPGTTLTALEKCMKSLPLPKYEENTTMKFDTYHDQVVAYFELMGMTDDANKIKLVAYAVSGNKKAKNMFEESKTKKNGFDEIMKHCVAVLDGKLTYTNNELIQQANNVFLKDYNDPKAYYQEFLNIKVQGNAIDETLLKDAFISGIHPPALKTSIKLLAKTTLFDNYQALEQGWEPPKPAYNVNFTTNRGRGHRGGQRGGFQARFSGQRQAGPSGFRGGFRGKPNYGQNRASNPNWRQQTGPDQIRCFHCGQTGHIKKKCPKLIRHRINLLEQEEQLILAESAYLNQTENFSGLGGNTQNFKVKIFSGRLEDLKQRSGSDHMILKNRCSNQAYLSSSNSGSAGPSSVGFPTEVCVPNDSVKTYHINFQGTNLVRHNIHLSGPKGKGTWTPIMDGGCERSVISLGIAQKLGLKINKKFNFRVLGINDVPNKNVVGYVDAVNFKIDGVDGSFQFSPIVINQPNCDLAGLELIKIAGGGTYKENHQGEMYFIFEAAKPSKSPTHSNIRIRVAEKTIIEPGKMAAIKISNNLFKKRNFIVEARNKKTPFVAIDGYMDSNSDRIYIANLSKTSSLTLEKDQYVANGYEADLHGKEKIGEITGQNSTKLSDQEIDIKIEQKIKHIRNDKIKENIRKILKKHITVFDIGSSGVGKYPYPVTINPSGKELAVKMGKRRVFNQNVWKKVNEELDKLENMDLIEDCPYPTVSPANLVAAKRKGTDRIRLCVDYVRLNEALVYNFFPLPTHDELLANFSRAHSPDSCFIKLDISNCFHNFRLCEEDKASTAFYTERGVKQWKALPFGIKSAPGIVQHAINCIVYTKMGLDPSTFKSVFIDDLLFKVDSTDMAPQELEIILETLNQYGLKIKFEKCEFLTTKTEYMGTNLSIENSDIKIKPNPKNIEALRDSIEPFDEKSLRGWIGMINWISKFLPQIHIELGPMYNVLKNIVKDKKIKFKEIWTKEIQDLYKSITREVSDPKTLSIPDYGAPYFLELDSCAHGMGAVLYQDDNNGNKKIIGFASKALSKEAEAYDNIHRETACAYWGIEKFAHFFSCSPHVTTVFTDNRVTSYIRSATSPKLRRWRSVLDSYNIKLVHKSGEKMAVSDALSRLIKNKNQGEYEPDLSDEILEEIVIATLTSKEGLELFQIHEKFAHCSANQLSILSQKPLADCTKVIENCFTCNSKKSVTETKQLLGTIADPKEKNHTWYFDFVFQDSKIKYLSLLDRSTRFFMLSKVDNREHKGVINRLKHEFLRLGKPKILIGDRELVSKHLKEFCAEQEVLLKPLPRESPFLNCVERHHRELKKIAHRINCDFEYAVGILNNLPFSKGPPGLNLRHATPAQLFIKNDKEMIKCICDFLEEESGKRALRSEELRGKNITRFERNFSIGDLVKFNMSNYVGLGKITDKKGSKIYSVERIDKSGNHELHAQQLELLKIPETFLRLMLQ